MSDMDASPLTGGFWRSAASLAAAALTLAAAPGRAQTPPPGSALIVQRLDESVRSSLAGNVAARSGTEHDLGAVPAGLSINDLALVLRRSAAQEQALETLIASQQEPRSALYHRWLTPTQFGARFGASAVDVAQLSGWLRSQGLTVKSLSHGRNLLRFSGTAAQVEAAFHTPIHYFAEGAERRFANLTDPQVPSALMPALAGVAGLHNFPPQPQHHRARAARLSRVAALPQFNAGAAGYGVGPADFSTIYNIGPLRNQGITGSGATIAIAAQSNIDPSLARAYWAAFGVAHGQNIEVVVPGGSTDPGQTGDSDEVEADLDVEIAGGVAQDATLVLVPSPSAVGSAAYAIDANLAPIVSISFGVCEAQETASDIAEIAAVYPQAAAMGITVVVAAGDQGAAACDVGDTSGPAPASHGTSVNGLASSAYDTAVGGTDFNFFGVAASEYWGATNAPGSFADALSYMPEMAWNTSCTNPVLLEWNPSFPNVETICNVAALAQLVTVDAGGGGMSALYAQPSWQTNVPGIPASAARAIPDLAFFAADGSLFGNSWVVCTYVNVTCNPAGAWGAADGYELIGGTSASTPAFAGILALLLQTQVTPANTDGRVGLINPLLYQLARTQFGTAQAPNSAALGSCNSNSGNAVGSACIFYDITTGANAPACMSGSPDCVTQTSGDAYGVQSANGGAGYAAAPGFDLATGLGSLNVTNFILRLWVPPPPAALSATPGNTTVTLHWPASNLAQTYNIYQGSAAGGEALAPVLAGVSGTTAAVAGLMNGKTYFFRIAAVNGGGTSAWSGEAQATVLPATPGALAATAGNGTVSLTWGASAGAVSYSVYRGTHAGGEGATAVQSGISGTTASLSGLTNGQGYFFRITAVNAGGSSAMSNEASAMPAAPSSGGGGGGGIGALELLTLALAGAWVGAGRVAARRASLSSPSR